MSIYKYTRCRACSFKKRDTTNNRLGPCKCGDDLYRSQSYYFTYHINGKRFEKSAGPDKKAAQEKEWKAKLAVAEGKMALPTSWDKSVERLEKTYRRLSPKTVEMYRGALKHLSATFGHMKLTDITEDRLEDYKDYRLDKNISGSTFNRERFVLKRLFSLSGIAWNFRSDVFQGESEISRDRFLDEKEKIALVRACKKTEYLLTAILVSLNTGLRRTSMLTLEWKDIDFKKEVVTKTGKGGRVHRIPLTGRLKTHLLERKLKQRVLSPFVFPSPLDATKPMADIRKSFNSACKAAGIENVRFHDLRRSFGSHLAMITKDLVLVQEMLGHADISTTRKHYAHLTDEHKKSGIKEYEEATNGRNYL